LLGEASQQVLGATKSAMVRTAQEVFDRHARVLGDGGLDGLVRALTVRYAVQDSR
jgi:hypothetical protein